MAPCYFYADSPAAFKVHAHGVALHAAASEFALAAQVESGPAAWVDPETDPRGGKPTRRIEVCTTHGRRRSPSRRACRPTAPLIGLHFVVDAAEEEAPGLSPGVIVTSST
jgi:hypothetical protein